MPPSNPFVAGAKLQNLRKFVGREEELAALTSRMSGVQPTSVNIVGEKRIGKSSLLYYFCLTWRQRILDVDKYVVIYLSLQGARCQREDNFYQSVAQELQTNSSVVAQEALVEALNKEPFNRLAFSHAIKKFKQHNLLPVLCLDDFESLFNYPQEFDNGFYDSLRSLMDDNALMLILTSCQVLDIHAHEHRLISSFFNLGHVIKLGELTQDEAIEITRFPDHYSINRNPALTLKEQNYALQWGRCHPYLVQLACSYLWEAKHHNKSIQWAKQKFQQEVSKMKPGIKKSYTGVMTQNLNLWKWLQKIGALPANIGNILERFTHTIAGLIILLLPILIIAGVLRLEEVREILQKLLSK
ncbi:MAG: ATP-binding protein [Calothrix sp. C42_A2020_038]|nr:ATP-binding protein [Calothrix sp. C42_A2020_038]